MIEAIVFFIGGLLIGWAIARFAHDEKYRHKLMACEQYQDKAILLQNKALKVIDEYNGKMESLNEIEREVREIKGQLRAER